MLRVLKVIGHGLPGGTSFMEDYTYHLDPVQPLILGAHMLEVCPSIAVGRPRIEIHPLGIGGREDPVRLVFDAQPGDALTACFVDMGNRFRMVSLEIEAVDHPPMPLLPVGRAVWKTKAPFKTAAAAWILGGGSHHTVYSQSVTREHLTDLAEMAGVELLVIGETTSLEEFKKELRINEIHYALAQGLRA
jgi:L-arabinose isomerase